MSGSGVRFTETMRGFVSTSALDDYRAGFDRGEADESPLEFTVTVTADDVDALVGDRDHEADLAGTVTAPALSPTPLKVEDGRFNLLVRDAEHAGARQMLYSMPLVADDGRRFHLDGYKQIRDEDGMDLWSDTTTLYVTVHEGEGTSGPVAAKGIVTIHAADFAKQMTTMRGVGGSPLDQLKAMATFGRMFAGALNESFGGVFARPSAFVPDAAPREHRAVDLRPGRGALLPHRRRRRAAADALQRRPEGPGDPGSRLRQLRHRVPARHHRAEPARAPPRGRATTCGCSTTAPARRWPPARRSSPSTTSRRTTIRRPSALCASSPAPTPSR